MPHDPTEDLDETLAAPLGEVISELGRGVSEAQEALDAQALDNFRRIYGGGEETLEALRDLGYQPTWYQIPEATAEVQIALSASGSTRSRRRNRSGAGAKGRRGAMQLYATPVDATYTNRYGFNLTASSKLTCRIVPVPPPSELESQQVAPDITGRTVDEARALLERLDIALTLDPDDPPAGDTVIRGQSPEPGALLAAAQGITILVD